MRHEPTFTLESPKRKEIGLLLMYQHLKRHERSPSCLHRHAKNHYNRANICFPNPHSQLPESRRRSDGWVRSRHSFSQLSHRRLVRLVPVMHRRFTDGVLTPTRVIIRRSFASLALLEGSYRILSLGKAVYKITQPVTAGWVIWSQPPSQLCTVILAYL